MTVLSAAIDTAPANDKLDDGIVGFIDIVEDRKVSGWAWNPADAGQRLEIEVRCEGRLISMSRAERTRADLRSASVGDGDYGFVAMLDEPLSPAEMAKVIAYALPVDGEPVQLLNRAKIAPPRLLSPVDGLLAEIRALREEAQGNQEAFRHTVQTAFGQMLAVLERMAETAKALATKSQQQPPAKPDDRLDKVERAALAKRLEALEAVAMRLDETLGRVNTRMDVLAKDASRGRIGHALVAAIAFGTIASLLTSLYTLFR